MLQESTGTRQKLSGIRFLMDYPDVLTPEECMNVLAIGRNSIYKLLNSGRLSAFRIGNKYRIPKASVEAFLKKCYTDGGIERPVPDEGKED